MNAIPTDPAVAIVETPAVTEEQLAALVPAWVLRLAAEGDGAPFIRMADFLAGGYSPLSRDNSYECLNRYVKRMDALTRKRGTPLVSLTEMLPLRGELPGRKDGSASFVSKRLFIISALGYMPRLGRFQP